MIYTPQGMPFYGTMAQQNHRRRYCVDDFDFAVPLFVTPTAISLPHFQILREGGPAVTAFQIWDAETDTAVMNLSAGGITQANVTGSTTLKVLWHAAQTITVNTPNIVNGKRYFFVVVCGAFVSYYSEVWRASNVSACDDHLRLSWSSPSDIDMTYLALGSAFSLQIPADIGTPSYLTEIIEAEPDARGVKEKVSRIVSKEYALHFYAPEWVLDALHVTTLFSVVNVNYFEENWQIQPLRLESDWSESGCYAQATLYFERIDGGRYVAQGC